MNTLKIGDGNKPSKNELIKRALQSVKVKDASINELGRIVSASVEKVIFYLGLKLIESDRDLIKVNIMEDVKQYFPSLTVSEIAVAIELGSHGNYGDVIGFAPKDAYNWIYAYVQSLERKEVVTTIEKENRDTTIPSDEELKALAWNNMLNAWAKYKEHGFYNDFGNSIYKMLVLNGKINYTEEQRADFKRIAKSNLNREFNPINSINNSIKMLENKKILAEVNGSPDNARLISEAKKVALNHFFKELVEIGSEIEDLF
jgi:hypothetical protein